MTGVLKTSRTALAEMLFRQEVQPPASGKRRLSIRKRQNQSQRQMFKSSPVLVETAGGLLLNVRIWFFEQCCISSHRSDPWMKASCYPREFQLDSAQENTAPQT